MDPPILAMKILLSLLLLGALFSGASGARAQSAPGKTVTVGDVNAPDRLFSDIMAAHAAGATTVEIAPGTYRITTAPGRYAWGFYDVSHLTICACDATLQFSDTAYEMLDFRRCRNIVFRGGVITGPPNFTQGQIIGAGADGRGNYMDVALDAGYPSDWSNANHWPTRPAFQVFDAKTRRFKPATGDYEAELPPTVLDAAARKYRFYLGGNTDLLPGNGRVVNGDFVGIRGYAGRFWNVDNCENIKFQDVTVDTANANAWAAGGSLNFVIDHCNFVYQHAPVAGGALGLLGPTGILSGNNRNGIVMTDTLWQGADDDVINSSAGSGVVGQTDGTTLIFSDGAVARGNTLNFVDGSGAFVGRATAIDDPAGAPAPPGADASRRWTRVTLDRALNLTAGTRIYNVNHTSLDFTMRNCVFQNFRDVGLIIDGDNALIENCVFDAGTVCAIVSEGFSNNLTIRNSVFSNNGFRWDYGNTDGGRNAGAIQIDKKFDNPDATGQAFQNTLIQNNTFIANAGLNIAVSNAQNTRIEGNLFLDTHPAGPRPLRPLRGLIFDQDSNAQIWLAYDRDLTLLNNVVVNAGPYANKIVGLGAGNTGINGAQSGVVTRTPQLYEAEAAQISNGTKGSGGGASGNAFVTALTGANSNVKFTVQAAAAGRYALVMRYNNGSRDAGGLPLMATHDVLVNGASAGSIIYPFTGAIGQFAPTYASSIVVTLRAGANTVEFRHEAQAAELDVLSVVQIG